jgi:hypothetical protein
MLQGVPGPGTPEQGDTIVAVIHRSSEQHSDPRGHAATRTAQLLSELSPNRDLVWLVERVSRADLPWVVIPEAAITAWEERDPAGWDKVSAWLAVQGITIVRI